MGLELASKRDKGRGKKKDSEPNTLPDFLDRTTRQFWVGFVSVCLHLTTKLHQVFAQVQKFPLILCETVKALLSV